MVGDLLLLLLVALCMCVCVCMCREKPLVYCCCLRQPTLSLQTKRLCIGLHIALWRVDDRHWCWWCRRLTQRW